jgi:hypothetical protein
MTASWTAGLGMDEDFTGYRVTITAPDGTPVYDGTMGAPATFLYVDDMPLTAGTLHSGVEYTLAIYAFSPRGPSQRRPRCSSRCRAACPVAPAPACAVGPVSVLPEVSSAGP